MTYADGYYWARFSGAPFIVEKIGDRWLTMGTGDDYTCFPRRLDFVPEGLVVLAGPLPAPGAELTGAAFYGEQARPIATIVRELLKTIDAEDRLEGGPVYRAIVEEAKAWLGEVDSR